MKNLEVIEVVSEYRSRAGEERMEPFRISGTSWNFVFNSKKLDEREHGYSGI